MTKTGSFWDFITIYDFQSKAQWLYSNNVENWLL